MLGTVYDARDTLSTYSDSPGLMELTIFLEKISVNQIIIQISVKGETVTCTVKEHYMML